MPNQQIYLTNKNWFKLHEQLNMSLLINQLLNNHFSRYDKMSKTELAKELKISKAEDIVKELKNGKN